jgi:hypothetical protein
LRSIPPVAFRRPAEIQTALRNHDELDLGRLSSGSSDAGRFCKEIRATPNGVRHVTL